MLLFDSYELFTNLRLYWRSTKSHDKKKSTQYTHKILLPDNFFVLKLNFSIFSLAQIFYCIAFLHTKECFEVEGESWGVVKSLMEIMLLNVCSKFERFFVHFIVARGGKSKFYMCEKIEFPISCFVHKFSS